MIRSIYTGASGVRNHQTKMDVIGNNIANVNTVGYKSSRTTFADMLSQSVKGATGTNGTIGGTNPLQVGLGLKVSSIDLMFQNGAPQVTGKNTDLCLSGDGLFVVQRGTDTYYTRDGAFEFDGAGNYVLPNSGHYVQGWMASDGVIDPSGEIGNINIKKGTVMEAKATDAVDYLDNLDASTPSVASVSGGEAADTGTTATPANPVTITLSDGTTVMQTEGTYKVGNSMPIASTVSVYDSLGETHNVPVYFIHEGSLSEGASPSRWLVSLTPDATVTKGAATTATYTDADGNTMTANLNVAEIQFDSSGQLVTTSGGDATGTLLLSYTGTGEEVPAAQSIAVDFTALTQLAGSNTIRSSGNGYVEGMLTEVQVDSSGIISGFYTNGQRRNEAQVAVAHFANSPGLIKDGTSLYKQTDNSGTPELNTAEHFGAVITPGAVEMSNTDVANEFAEMIITQRGFQSNSKIITVGDQMVETAVNMKR